MTDVFPSSKWTAEIRFPIAQTPGYSTKPPTHTDHGGLLDADPVRQREYDTYHPKLGAIDPRVDMTSLCIGLTSCRSLALSARGVGEAGPNRPRYWWIDFARAEHTRVYSMPDGTQQVCPKNCTRGLEAAINSTVITQATT